MKYIYPFNATHELPRRNSSSCNLRLLALENIYEENVYRHLCVF
jgi:hypothetical protein